MSQIDATPLRVKIIFPLLTIPTVIVLLASIVFLFVALFGGLLSENGPHGLYHATIIVAAAVLTIALLTDHTIFRRGERSTSFLRALLSWKSLERLVVVGALGALLLLAMPWVAHWVITLFN